MDETMGYENFKENKAEEVQQTMDDLDDFERRLAGGAPIHRPGAAKKAVPIRSVAPPGMAKPGAKKGSEYVKASRVAKTEEQEEDDESRRAVADLGRFDDPGYDSD